MSTKPLTIKKDSVRYKLYLLWSHDKSPKRVWQYRLGVLAMSGTYIALALMCVVVVMAVILMISIPLSPVYDHFWPGSWYFGALHRRSWPRYRPLLPFAGLMLVIILALRAFQKPLLRLASWIWAHRPKARPIHVVEN